VKELAHIFYIIVVSDLQPSFVGGVGKIGVLMASTPAPPYFRRSWTRRRFCAYSANHIA